MVRKNRAAKWTTVAAGWTGLLGCCVAAGILTGCGQRETVLQRDQAQYPTAVSVYESGCITCHGDNLQGGIGPNLQHVGSNMTLATIVHQVQVGGGAMPAYALPGDPILTPSQIHAVAAWLETKK